MRILFQPRSNHLLNWFLWIPNRSNLNHSSGLEPNLLPCCSALFITITFLNATWASKGIEPCPAMKICACVECRWSTSLNASSTNSLTLSTPQRWRTSCRGFRFPHHIGLCITFNCKSGASHSINNKIVLLFSSSPSIECLQRVNFPRPIPNHFPALLSELSIWPWFLQAYEPYIFGFPATRQKVIGNMLEMRLDSCGVVKILVMAKVGEGFWVLFEL